MLLIIVGHISGTMGTVVFSPLPATGVTLFLLVSGYGLNESYKSRGLAGFWMRRVRRVIVPYFFVIVVYRLCKGYLEPLPFLLDVVGLDTTYWFVEYIVYWYIAFYVTSRLLLRWRVMAMVAVGLVMLLTLESLEAGQSFSFVAGVVASQCSGQLRLKSRRWWLWTLLAAMIVGIGFLGVKQLPVLRAHIGEVVYDVVHMCHNLGFAVAVVAFFAVSRRACRSRFLLFIGAISYELYLIHFPFYGRVHGSLALAFAFLAAWIVAAWCYHWLIDRLLAAVDRRLGRG